MDLKSKDIVDIINACGKNGVSSIKIGDMDIGFNGFVFQTEKDYPVTADQTEGILVDPNFKHQQDLESGYEDDEELLILDPAAYEDKYFKNELVSSEE